MTIPVISSDRGSPVQRLKQDIEFEVDLDVDTGDISESAIIADLMHGLGDRLRMSDTSLQRKVMCWKYKMLNHKFDFDDVRASLDRIRRALTNGGCH